MTATSAPEAALGVLPRADGSAKYSHAGYTVTASVNGPIEAQRRDEHAYEAHIDVIVRPAAGVGGEGAPAPLRMQEGFLTSDLAI
jgi:exosome complex component RRP46